jgi:intracellular multiplication protein IcmK
LPYHHNSQVTLVFEAYILCKIVLLTGLSKLKFLMRERVLKKTSYSHPLLFGMFALCLMAPAISHAQDATAAGVEAPPRPDPQPPGTAPLLPGLPAGEPTLPGGAVPDFFSANDALAPEPGLSKGASDDFNFEKSQEELDQEVRSEAFNAALQSVLPLRPEEIRTLLEHFDRTQESVEVPVYPSPKPEIAVETISLDPGAPPAVINVAYGNVTTLTILDMTGAPWPIEDISWAGNFEIVESSSSQGSHIIRISPQSEFANGNMSIRLLTLKTPVILSLETSRDKVHYRFDAIIPDYGPMAEAPLIDKGISTVAGDTNIASILQGVIPEKATKLDVSGVDGRTTAYSFSGQTFIRTPLTLLSPAWNSSVTSADGMRVYSIKGSPVLLLSDKGRMVRARVSARENILGDFIDGR